MTQKKKGYPERKHILANDTRFPLLLATAEEYFKKNATKPLISTQMINQL